MRLIDVFSKQYIVGLKSWGYLFMVMLLVGIVFTIVVIPAFTPVSSLMLAAANNAQGVAMGDPSGLPALRASPVRYCILVGFCPQLRIHLGHAGRILCLWSD